MVAEHSTSKGRKTVFFEESAVAASLKTEVKCKYGQKGYYRGYPLQDAAHEGDHDAVLALIAAGVEVNTQYHGYKRTAVMMAAGSGRADVVQSLIEAKADLDVVDVGGFTALMLGARSGDPKTVRALTQGKANLDSQNETKWTALMYGAYEGRTEVVQALIDAGANLDLQNELGRTALILAAYYEHYEIVKRLADAGADLNLIDRDGDTALDDAVRLRRPKMQQLLQSVGGKRACELPDIRG